MSGDQSDIDFRDDRIFIPHNSGKKRFSRSKSGQKIVSQFLFDRLGDPATLSQFLEIGGSVGIRHRILVAKRQIRVNSLHRSEAALSG